MIFVCVGNATQGFRRLLDAVDELAGSGMLNESVTVQSGNNTDFHARHCSQQEFFPPEEFRELIDKADVVVCHGGAGTLQHVFQAGKTPVVMPRRRKYGEHIDDQLELVKAIAKEGRIIPVFEPDDLSRAILEAKRRKRRTKWKEPEMAFALISQAINELAQCTSSA